MLRQYRPLDLGNAESVVVNRKIKYATRWPLRSHWLRLIEQLITLLAFSFRLLIARMIFFSHADNSVRVPER